MPTIAYTQKRLGATISLAFGYDTNGLQRFLQTDNFVDLLDGLFLLDRQNADGSGQEVRELVLDASLTAAAKLNGAAVSASVGGGIFAGLGNCRLRQGERANA